MPTGLRGIKRGISRPAYEITTNVEDIPNLEHYGTRPKYYPKDWTGSEPRGEDIPTPQTGRIFQDGKSGIFALVANLKGQVIKGKHQVKVSKNYNKAQDMIEEGRRSPIAQIFNARKALNPLRAIHNPTRKMFEEAYSQPIQEFGFAKSRQMNGPAGKRALNRGQTGVQPNLKSPTPTQPVDTAMPWNIPQ